MTLATTIPPSMWWFESWHLSFTKSVVKYWLIEGLSGIFIDGEKESSLLFDKVFLLPVLIYATNCQSFLHQIANFVVLPKCSPTTVCAIRCIGWNFTLDKSGNFYTRRDTVWNFLALWNILAEVWIAQRSEYGKVVLQKAGVTSYGMV